MNKVGTLRFDISLDLINTESYEVSFLDLMKQTDKNLLHSNKDEIEEMNNYAKQLEKKYGPVAVVKGKKIRVNDFLIQGTGYDVDDPFIDDSGTEEAVVVAPDLMTQYGGFYINNDTIKWNESSFVIERVEGEDDSTFSSKQHFQHKNSKLTKSQQLLSQAKKRLSTTKKALTNTQNHTLDEIINDIVGVKNKKEINLKVEVEPHKNSKKQESTELVTVNKSVEKEPISNPVINQTIQKPIILPPNLPKKLTEKIELLIEISNHYKTDRTKISNQFNSVLMEIDAILATQTNSKVIRSQVLRYISSATDIKYECIVRRITKFKENRKKNIQAMLLKSLQEAINEAMPVSTAKYDTDMKVHLMRVDAQRAQQAALQQEASGNQIINIDLTINSPEPTETKSKPLTNQRLKPPKRTFKWTNQCKSLLVELVTGELESLKQGKSKITPEEQITKFFNGSVIGLWPPKWMTTLQLVKMSSSCISEFRAFMSNINGANGNGMGKDVKSDPTTGKTKSCALQQHTNNTNNQKAKQVANGHSNKLPTNATGKLSDNKAKPILVLEPTQSPPAPPPISPSAKLCADKGNRASSGLQLDPYHDPIPAQLKYHLDQHLNHHTDMSKTAIHRQPPVPEQHKNVCGLSQSPQTATTNSSNHKLANRMTLKHTVATQQGTTKPLPEKKESTKRASIEPCQSGSSSKTLVMNHHHQQFGDQSPNQHSLQQIMQLNCSPIKTDDSLPYLFNHVLANHSNAVGHSTLNPTDQPLCLGHHKHQNIVTSNTISNNNHFSHSAPYSHIITNNASSAVSPPLDNMHKLTSPNSGSANRQSVAMHASNMNNTIQSISTMLNPSSIETRQNIPQHLSMNKSNLMNQHNLQQAQNLQRHYLGLQSDFESPNKALYHPHSTGSTIDLIESPIAMNAHQLSPDMYYNFNNHFNNQRRFQN